MDVGFQLPISVKADILVIMVLWELNTLVESTYYFHELFYAELLTGGIGGSVFENTSPTLNDDTENLIPQIHISNKNTADPYFKMKYTA